MKKRIFTMILVLMLILTCVPASVFAEESGSDQTSDKAVEAVQEESKEEVKVTVSGAPEGAKLTVKEASKDSYEDAIKEELGDDYKVVMALDIALKTEDDSALKEKVKVSVKSDELKNLSKDAVLYHIKGDKAEKVKYNLKKKKGTIAFKTKSFSPFVLAVPAEEKKEEVVEEKPAEEKQEEVVEEKPATEEKKEEVVEEKPATEEKQEEVVEEKPATEEKKEVVEEKPAEEKQEEVVEEKPATEEKKEVVEEKPATEEKKEEVVEEKPATEKKEEVAEEKPATEKKETKKEDAAKPTKKTEKTIKGSTAPSPVDIQFSGLKTLTGRDLAAEEFSFTLEGSNDAAKETKETVKNDAKGKISFTKLTYKDAGEYTYTVKEEKTSEAGVTGDSKVYKITVTVTEDKNGQLVAAISGDTKTGDDLNFTNTYKPAPVDVQFSGTKTLKGKKLTSGEFSFTLKGSNGVDETVKNDADGKITFTKLTFEKEGEYTYTVKEKKSKEAGVTTDSKTYKITVKVTDDKKGKLVAAISGDSKTGKDLNFKNKYETGSLTISKNVTGDLGDKNKYFTFTVTFGESGKYSFKGSKTGTISSGESFKLKHGESITISDVPAGTSYKVVESDNAGYTVSKKNDAGSIVANKDVKAVFNNTKSSVPKTGDDRNLMMWIGLLMAAVLGVVGILAFGRKKR